MAKKAASPEASRGGEYQVLSRKWRPKLLTEMVGQEGLCRSLTRAFETGRLPQAWLLAGPSGVGKTTTARILARCLSCTGVKEPTAKPCGDCESCRSILGGESLDLLEIDGASNNRVDEVRALREHVEFLPQQSRYRIIIIDEVHMLSTAAFNALLKTLEEPPSHVKFILATTEPDRIPATVRARCQRHDLSPVPVETLDRYLKKVAESEGLKFEEGASWELARLSSGSVRNALSLLDQLGSEGTVTREALRRLSGEALPSHIVEIADHVLEGRVGPALTLLDGLMSSGSDPRALVDQWIQLLRRRLEQVLGAVDHGLGQEKAPPEKLIAQGTALLALRSQLGPDPMSCTLLSISAAKLAQGTGVTAATPVAATPAAQPLPEGTKPLSELSGPLLARRLEESGHRTLAGCLAGALAMSRPGGVLIEVPQVFHRDLISRKEAEPALRSALAPWLKPGGKIEVRAPEKPYIPDEEESLPEDKPVDVPPQAVDDVTRRAQDIFKGRFID
ncbi:MAG: DNA polymerase III subunit gamma/tau [Planctomycetota bacterium]